MTTVALRGDPHAQEPAVELEAALFLRWKEAKSNTDAWAKEEAKLRKELEEAIGAAHAGLVNGVKVVTFRPVERWAESSLVRDYPELAEHFRRTEPKVVLDLAAFRAAHPEIVDQYQSRSFRLVAE